MSFFFGVREPVGFTLWTTPPEDRLGQLLETRTPLEFCLHFGFGSSIASELIPDVWSACCELRLQSELVRSRELTHFVLDARELFDVSHDGDLVICRYSKEHVFAVRLDEFASAIDGFLARITRTTRFPRLTEIAIERRAGLIRGQPYFYRFCAEPAAVGR